MDTTPGNRLRDQSEHRSITIGDLAALIAGIAVVLVLPTRQGFWPLPSDFVGAWPRWFPWCFCLRQALGAACVALMPVVFSRRAHHGGFARPAEFLVLCAAMPFLADSIETALIRLSLRLQTYQSPPGFGLQGMPPALIEEWRKGSHWVWEQNLLLSGAVAIAGFYLARRKLPGWLLTAQLIIAWLGVFEAGTRLASRWTALLISRLIGGPIGNTLGVLIFAVVFLLPRFILFSVPAIAAVHDVRHNERARPSWLEWTGLALGAATFLIAEPMEFVRNYSTTGIPDIE